MAIQISYGDPNEFNYLIYGEKDPGTLNYLENQFTKFSNVLSDAGHAFFSNAKSVYDSFNSSEALRLARAAVRKVGSLFRPDAIRSILELGDMQTAPLTMQRFIMAEPTVRQMYHEQRIDGYSDSYVDMDPGVTGENHYDYRRVMDGIVQTTDDGDEFVTWYIDDLRDGDRTLDITEKVDIMNTWDIVKDLLLNGDRDPTSVWGNKL